jgi:hypothetical protein
MILMVVAGVLQLGVAAANLPLSWILRFGRAQRGLDPIVRQIHRVHHVYLVVLLGIFGLISIVFPRDLCGQSDLGRAVAATLSLFWGARLAVQRFYYDANFLRQHRAGDVAFSLVFAFLCGAYAAGAAGALR